MDSRLFWLALAAFVGSTEGGLVSGLLPSIAEDMNVTAGQTGQLVMGYSLASQSAMSSVRSRTAATAP